MMRMLLASVASVAFAPAVSAHHSAAAYDMTREVVIEGVITGLQWKNPHIYLEIETAGVDGAPLTQEVEAGPLSVVRTFGLRRELVLPGAQVVVRGNPSRRARTIRGLDVVTADGAVYALNPQGSGGSPRAAVRAEGLAGNWVPTAAGFLEFLQASRSWPLAEATLASRDDAQSTIVTAGVCEAWPAPHLTSLPFLRSIEVSGDAVVMRLDAEGVDAVRTIHLDQAEHPADVEPTLLGHSIGWWEGETLVVDTVAFSPNRSGLRVGVPSGPRKHMVERLSLTEDRLHLRHEFVLEDPDYLAEPVSFSALWEHRPDLEPSGEPCDPDIAVRFLEEE